jgi:hypothetical protein
VTVAAAPPIVRFRIDTVEAWRGHAVPTLRLRLFAEADDARAIRSLALGVRVRIAAERRRYDGGERERLGELFGTPDQWSRSLGGVPWTETALNVPFEPGAPIDVPLPCTYDFEVASAKYLAALVGGEIPIDVLLSGAIFYAASDGRLQTARIPWDGDLSARVPLRAWREAVDAAFPDSAWLRIARETFGALQAFRSRRTLTSWDEVMAALLAEAER